MREREYKARDKVVQKMTRDGLAERNLAEGTEQGISQRPADYSFRQGDAGGNGSGGGRQGGSGAEQGSHRAYPRHIDRTGGHGETVAPQEHRGRQDARGVREDTSSFQEQKTEAEPTSRHIPNGSRIGQEPKEGYVHSYYQEGVQGASSNGRSHMDAVLPDRATYEKDGFRQDAEMEKPSEKLHDRSGNSRIGYSGSGYGRSHSRSRQQTVHVGKELETESRELETANRALDRGSRMPDAEAGQFHAAEESIGGASSQGDTIVDKPGGDSNPYMLDVKAQQAKTMAGSRTSNRRYSQRDQSQAGIRREAPGRESHGMGRHATKKVQRAGARSWREQNLKGYGYGTAGIGKPEDGNRTDNTIHKNEEMDKYHSSGDAGRQQVNAEAVESAPNGAAGQALEWRRAEPGTVQGQPEPGLRKSGGRADAVYRKPNGTDGHPLAAAKGQLAAGTRKRISYEPEPGASGNQMDEESRRAEKPGKVSAAAGRGPKAAASRKLLEAEKRLEAAKKGAARAEGKLPVRYKLKLEDQESGSPGRRKGRLRFEAEAVPENKEPSLLKRTGGGLVHTAQLAALSKAHQKVRETEQDNVGVESAHKTEAAVERAGTHAYRIRRERLRSKPYRTMRRAEKRVVSAEGNVAYRKFLADNPELQKKNLAKLVQKQKIKRKYAAAARKAAKGAGQTAGALVSTGKSASRMTQYFKAGKSILVIIVGAILLLVVFGSLFTSCSSMSMGMGSAVASACYTAEDAEINQSELRYTELETDLQLEIADTERDYPGYDEYRYNIGEIGHNPYELMGYLSAVFGDFTYTQIEAELYRLFGLQYQLTHETVTETRTYLDEEGEEQEYEWRILKTVLSVRPLSGILSGSFPPGDSAERYGIYMQTCGGRQAYGSPFGFPWLGYVTSPYGYRVHPINGGKDLHRGVDIAVSAGTPILAVQDGWVISAADAGGYGLCLVIEGEGGYQSRYAHCSSFAVNVGQEVKKGDVVAYVGSTGDSTGPHLHLEVAHNGEYLNPYFFVENGGGGYTAAGDAAGRPQFPDDPGEPMGDGTFEAMLEVAERYMGMPYVWGGSSPSTSFDCSGYVSYVINQSGAGSVGRQTAQGLCNLCTPVAWEDLQPGDLVFFTGTYSSPTPVSHVGIYVGGGRMAHAGDPIGYADIAGSQYWRGHFYCGGRLP